MKKENRRDFIEKTGAVAAGLTLGGNPNYNSYIAER